MSGEDSRHRAGSHTPSSSRQRASVEYDPLELERLFECPVCSDSVLPPIIQCANGHLVCSECLRKVAGRCPTCREPIGNIRNLALETLANKIIFSCQFKSGGCPERLPAEDKAVHQRSCAFRPIHCPYRNIGCSWEGAVDELVAHLLGSHQKVQLFNGNEMVVRAKFHIGLEAGQWIWIQLCFGHAFLLTLRSTQIVEGTHHFSAVMQSIGTNGAAGRFACHLDYHAADGLCSFEGMLIGMHDSVDLAMENGDCLQFDVSSKQIQFQGGLVRIKSTVTKIV